MPSMAEHPVVEAYVRAFGLYIDNADFDEIGPALVEARDMLEVLTHRSVQRAVEQGHSWTSIGASLGVSRQAAKQRFGAGI